MMAAANSVVDFDLHGIVGVRLYGASPKDAAAVARQLGLGRTTLGREPDIVIRFVDRLSLSSPLVFVGLQDAAFTQDAFLVLRSKHKSSARVQIPMDRIGRPCEIRCERGLAAVPLLIPILNLTALGKGCLPLHAAAFAYQGVGALVTGWSKGGKTEALLAAMDQGAHYVGDEWIYVTDDGRCMRGIPEPVRLWRWHLTSMPHYRKRLSRQQRVRLDSLHHVGQTLAWASQRGLIQAGTGRRFLFLLKSQLHVDVPPDRLFGPQALQLAATLDRLFFVASHETREIVVRQISPQEVARRMVFSLQEEQQRLTSSYLKYRFAFPEARNLLLEESQSRQAEALEQLLADKDAYAVYHPYPFSLPALFEAMRPHLAGG